MAIPHLLIDDIFIIAFQAMVFDQFSHNICIKVIICLVFIIKVTFFGPI